MMLMSFGYGESVGAIARGVRMLISIRYGESVGAIVRGVRTMMSFGQGESCLGSILAKVSMILG